MLILPSTPSSEITPERIYQQRREWMKQAAILGAATLLPNIAQAGQTETPNSFEEITQYNNFYEFGTDKSDPAREAHRLRTEPWSVLIDGEVETPRRFALEELLKLSPQQERILRLRCVEGWSMVIPWQGYSLSQLLKQVRPTSRAKFVEFTSVLRPTEMPGQKEAWLDWPYVEGLRIDEAIHPLTTLVFGLYGKPLPKQNGAPVRLIVPWKYGFKSAKSIVRIRFVETMPRTSWNRANPREYGFYSNVNPAVAHPRWSQAKERRIGEFFKRDTLLFNGYADQVAALYRGMDLGKWY